ncbi:conserved hypothetical protein [Ricinus communis]|uniref:DUF4283 domain-containing protein n=1 Tax=Ricinus communis TaxID=3988 RepID=B9SRP2_RICCO|nr:conserved hypothetical protein [Ricinus communis]
MFYFSLCPHDSNSLTKHSLADLYSQVSLEDEELNGLDVGKGQNEPNTIDLRWSRVGHYLIDKPLNVNFMKQMMASIWQSGKGVYIRELSPNLFLFQLFYEMDIRRVLEGSPWLFNNHLLLIKRLAKDEQPTKIGHVDRFCDRLFNHPSGEVPRPYGSWMRVASRRQQSLIDE